MVKDSSSQGLQAVINIVQTGNTKQENTTTGGLEKMMERTIAVDEDLKGLKEALASQGYDVVGLEKEEMERADAVVISGMEQNVMLMEEIRTKVPVISAVGKTSEDIVKRINDFFEAIH